MADLVFKTTLKEITLTIDDRNYILRELDGIQKGKYLNSMGGRIKLNSKGEVQAFTDYSGLETSLLRQCLYDDAGELVSADVMNKWPSSMLSSLFAEAQKLSGLTEEARKDLEAEAKNS